MKRGEKKVFWAVILIEFFVFLWLSKDYITTSNHYLFWMQTFAGNWSPPERSDYSIDHLEIVLAWIIALMLNLGSILLLYNTLVKLVAFEEKKMIAKQVIAVHQQLAKQELFDMFPDDPRTVDKINIAFERGEQKVKQYLLVMFPKEEVDAFFNDPKNNQDNGYGNGGPGGPSNGPIMR